MILFLHAGLFVALYSFNPACVVSLLYASFYLRFGCPLLLFPGMSTSCILLTMCSSFFLVTWPYHLSGFSVIFLDACVILVVPIQSVSLGSTTDIVSPGHTILWLPPHLIPAQPCPFIYIVQPLSCWSSS